MVTGCDNVLAALTKEFTSTFNCAQNMTNVGMDGFSDPVVYVMSTHTHTHMREYLEPYAYEHMIVDSVAGVY
jgi:hypothetical protein